jgi:hypothetical protein
MRKSTKVMVGAVLGGSLGLFAAGSALAQTPSGKSPEKESAPDYQQQTQPEQAPPSTPPAERPSGQPEGAPTGQQGTTTPSGEETQAPVASMAEVATMTARVEKVDAKKRKLTLKDPDGKSFTVQVPQEVPGMDKVKKGDKVDLTYYESVAVSVLPARHGAPAMAERVVGQRETAGGTVVREINVTTPITKVDKQKNTITVKTPEGTTRTIKVQDPQLQQRLGELRPGNVVEVTYTEAVATAIEPSSSSRQGN